MTNLQVEGSTCTATCRPLLTWRRRTGPLPTSSPRFRTTGSCQHAGKAEHTTCPPSSTERCKAPAASTRPARCANPRSTNGNTCGRCTRISNKVTFRRRGRSSRQPRPRNMTETTKIVNHRSIRVTARCRLTPPSNASAKTSLRGSHKC